MKIGLAVLLVALLALAWRLNSTTTTLARQQQQIQTLTAALADKSKQDALALQEKCASAAKAYFSENLGPPDKNTYVQDYTNHFSQNKCFIQITHNYKLAATSDAEMNIRSLTIFDVYERVQWGEFVERSTFYLNLKPNNSQDHVVTCVVAGRQCKSLDEFKALSRPYVSE